MDKATLFNLYTEKLLSVPKIAQMLGCSDNRIVYWLNKHKIPRRSRSEASYLQHNPQGDPFVVRMPQTVDEALLFGLGMGLFWGEGNKANTNSIRLGNTDPFLIIKFIEFLETSYGINRNKLKFGLQLFDDCDKEQALRHWQEKLRVERSQFYKITVTISGSIGTYRNKNRYGVMTVYFHNTKLRKILGEQLADIAQW